ncbi:MAG: ankyrin repeat domain-containing protein, partial [Deltaproteobacteria bacterium]|nr:ankyrin repeat domain-containing protein [Deltaproteobacteria bacterium]
MLVSNDSLADGFIDNFFISITLGDAGAIQSFLARGVDANVMDANGNTALIIAAREGQVEILRTLHMSGAKLNSKNQFGESALMLAALNGHTQVVNTLLGLGAD